MKKYLKIILFCTIAYSLILGSYYAFAKAYWFDGSSDLCQDLCGSVSGWSLWKCSVNFPDDGDVASGYACIYQN